MTIDELRKIEEFLDECAELHMSLASARAFVAARILGNELNVAEPALGINDIEGICESFLSGERTDT